MTGLRWGIVFWALILSGEARSWVWEDDHRSRFAADLVRTGSAADVLRVLARADRVDFRARQCRISLRLGQGPAPCFLLMAELGDTGGPRAESVTAWAELNRQCLALRRPGVSRLESEILKKPVPGVASECLESMRERREIGLYKGIAEF